MSKRIILKPLSRDGWAGVVKYKNCYEDITPYWTKNGQIYTGLTKEDEKELGAQLGLDLSPRGEFFAKFFIRVGREDIILDSTDPFDVLKIKFLEGHRRVTNSSKLRTPVHTFALINLEDEAKAENEKHKLKRKAYKEFDKISKNDIVKVLRLYGYATAEMQGDVAENRLNDLVENDPEKFLDVWVNNKDRETQFLIEEAISKNVIRKNKGNYTYGTDSLGNGLHEVISYLKNPKNSDIRIIIENETKVKG